MNIRSFSFTEPLKKHGKSRNKIAKFPYNPKTTVAEVARELESRFGIIDTFAEKYKTEIAQIITSASVDRIFGRMTRTEAYAEIQSKIRKHFQAYLRYEEHGIKTKTALIEGRQSFIDTGEYKDLLKVKIS